MVKQCMYCGYQLEDAAKFCPGCGKAAAAQSEPPMLKCAYCGAELYPTSKFCPKCGKKAGNAQRQNQTQEQTPPASGCAHCGAQLYPTSKFCPKCGKAVLRTAPLEQPPTAPLPQSQPPVQVPAPPPEAKAQPKAEPKPEAPQRKSNLWLILVNALLFLTALGLLFLNIRVVPEKIKEASASSSASPIEENVVTDEIQAEYDILSSGGSLLGKDESESERIHRNDYSGITDKDKDGDGEK
ncbi:zinc ribbon domain-containing protein [bacterium]|nr:zinc ribbon domain-containing protein [bacterium]